MGYYRSFERDSQSPLECKEHGNKLDKFHES